LRETSGEAERAKNAGLKLDAALFISWAGWRVSFQGLGHL